MSQKNVEIVRSPYDAWARDGFPGPLGVLDPEIEYVNPAGAVEPGTRRGREAFRLALEKVFEGWETWDMDPEEFCRRVGMSRSFATEFRKMLALARLMQDRGVRLA